MKDKITEQMCNIIYGKTYTECNLGERKFINAYVRDFCNPQWKKFIYNDKETNYEISNIGQVHNWKQNRKVDVNNNKAGIPVVNLKIDGSWHQFPVHRLVAQLFVSNPSQYPEVVHINGNKQLSWYQNLKWTTREEMVLNGIGKVGERNNSKFTEQDVINVVSMYKQGKKINDIVKELNVSKSFVIGVLYRGEWKSVTSKLNMPTTTRSSSVNQIRDVCKLLEKGVTPGIIATEVGVSTSVVYAVASGKAHRQISNEYDIPGLPKDESISGTLKYRIHKLFDLGIMNSSDIISKLGLEDTRSNRKYISRLRVKYQKSNK